MKSLRENLIKLIINGISYSVIFTLILKNLIDRDFTDTYKREIIKYTAFYDKRAAIGSKPSIHFEAWIARLMLIIYKSKHAKSLSKNKIKQN